MEKVIRQSSRFEYAFSTMYNSVGVVGHELNIVDSNNINEALIVLNLPSTHITRYAAAKKLAESDIVYRFNQKELECNIISSIGSLIPISPSILNPFMN